VRISKQLFWLIVPACGGMELAPCPSY